ncbi:MAG: hypothetical protein E7551_07985 [Ruminococcaceae bacterium]|nr:hypothetical protein [Oscillospiraceae bacterium]
MIFKIFKTKKFKAKAISVFMAVIMICSLMPMNSIFASVSAAEMPEYDPTLGEYSANGNVLTATPYENCGFRGWFDENGNEVSVDTEFTVPSGASADDYTPVFYDFNLAINGSFEEYAAGTNLKTGVSSEEIWEGRCDAEIDGGADWTTAVVTSNRAKTGTKSLKAFSQFNTTYHTFYGLEQNVQYTVSFWYNLDADNQNYLSFVSVLGEDTEISATANSNNGEYLAHKTFTTEEGSTASGEWKKASLTFYTGKNKSVRLAILYNSQNSEGSPANAPIYIDDVALVKDASAAPDYINEDFAKSSANWKTMDLRCVTIEHSNQRLKVNSLVSLLGYSQSPVIRVKKGADYTFTFKLDMSEIEDIYVPKFKLEGYSTYVLLTDESLISEDNPKGYVWDLTETGNKKPNWINFSFGTEYLSHSGSYASASGSTITWTVTDANGLTYSPSGGGFGKQTLADRKMDVSNPLTVTCSFTALTTDDIYLNTRLNGLGTYYIDDVVLTENSANVDLEDLVKANTINAKGTAIRTVGKQGMRNKTTLDKALLTAENPYGIRVTEYGTVAIKTELLSENELVLDGEYSFGDNIYGAKTGVAYSFNDNIDLVFENRQASLDFTGVLINIAKENWNVNYTARPYLKYIKADGTEGVIYGESADIAVYPISKMAYTARTESGDFAESDKVRDYLYKNIISNYTDKVVTVNNNSAPIHSNFQGIRSTVYHATTFFPDTTHGRAYTEEEAAIEMDRLVDSGIDNVRTRFASQWMWNGSTGWDWNSTKMNAIYKWAKMLQDRDISITINASWHLSDFVLYYTSKSHSSIPEVNYMHGYNTNNEQAEDLYGEDDNAAAIEAAGRAIGLNLTDDEYAHYSVAAARYGEWMRQALNALKANGVNNVEYLLPFTETGYGVDGDATAYYDEWIIMTLGLHMALEEEGIRGDYRLIGPSQSLYKYMDRLSLLEYTYQKIDGTEYADLIDINSSHAYTKPNTYAGYENTVYEPNASYSMAEENFIYYDQLLTDIGQRDKEFWCDEFFAGAGDIKYWDGVDMQAVQVAVGVVSGANNGINRLSLWQMFDCLWDSSATHGSAYIDRATEFIGGVHACGTCPSFIFADGFNCVKGESCPCHNYYEFSSYTPRTTYYGVNLIGKYLNSENASVYGTSVANGISENDGGLFTTAIKNDDGNTVILVVNTENEAANVNIQLEKKTDTSYTRYTYESGNVFPTEAATSIPSDKTISVYGANSFDDVIPARSFSIYVSNAYGFVGEDSEIPLD